MTTAPKRLSSCRRSMSCGASGDWIISRSPASKACARAELSPMIFTTTSVGLRLFGPVIRVRRKLDVAAAGPGGEFHRAGADRLQCDVSATFD